MDEITKRFSKYYKATYKKYGPNFQGVDWKNQDEAEIRYKAMLNVIRSDDLTGKKKTSVLDVGCGYGGLYIYAKANGINTAYVGIDLVPEMIKTAKEKIKDAKFYCIDIFEHNSQQTPDYVICNGILTQKLENSQKQMWKFSQKLINRMFKLANKGVVFNTMSTKVDFKRDGNFYVDPAKMLTEALKHTRYAKIDHTYPLYEYSVYMYKQAA